jgi:type III secretion protein L
MDFFVCTDPLKPRRALEVMLDPAARVVRRSAVGVLQQAEQVVQRAGAQADALLEQAQDTLEEHRGLGFDRGWEEAQVQLASAMVQQSAHLQAHCKQLEADLVALVVHSVSKVIHGFDDATVVQHLVRSGLDALRCEGPLTVHVHPQTSAALGTSIDQLLVSYPHITRVEVLTDARLAPTDCVLEGPAGLVECSLGTVLAGLHKGFVLAALDRASEDSALNHTVSGTLTSASQSEFESALLGTIARAPGG